MSSRPRLVGWGACAALVLVAAGVRFAASLAVSAPWIAPDEPTYGMLGRSLWRTGRFLLLGEAVPFYGLVYPAFVGAPLTLFDAATGMRVVQGLQALLMSSTAFVVYAWGRRLVRPAYALAAAALALALPGLSYSSLLMSEAAYVPIATLALLAIARSLETPSIEWQAVAVAAIFVASLTRLQGLVLVPVLLTAVVLAALLGRSGAVLRQFAPTLLLLAVAAAVLAWYYATRESSDALGVYSTTTQTSYHPVSVAEWTIWHAADAFLLVCGIPLLGTMVLAAVAVVRGERSAPARALLAVAVAYLAWSVLQVGAFASRFTDMLAERYLLTLAPILFLGFVLWLERGLPRPRHAVAGVLALALAPVAALPPARLSDPALQPVAFTADAFVHLRGWLSGTELRTVWIAGAAVLALAFAALPRRLAAVLPVTVLVLLAASSALAARDVAKLSHDLRSQLLGPARPDWVDRSAAGPVAYVYAGGAYWNDVWLTVFWNRRIDRVAAFSVHPSGSLPPNDVVSPHVDGSLVTADGRAVDSPFVVGPNVLTFAGTPVASVTQTTDVGGATLWRVDRPLRLTTIRSGVQPNGDIVGTAQVDVFSCSPGRLELTLLGKSGTPVRLSVDGVPRGTVDVPPGSVQHVSIATPAFVHGVARCTFRIDSPGLLGSTRIAFVPERA